LPVYEADNLGGSSTAERTVQVVVSAVQIEVDCVVAESPQPRGRHASPYGADTFTVTSLESRLIVLPSLSFSVPVTLSTCDVAQNCASNVHW
jgi:hypothetical protein